MTATVTETDTIPVPFGRVVKLGSRGKDILGIRRAERRWEGVNDPDLGAQTFAPADVLRTRRFQRAMGIPEDGIYGPRTHDRLEPFYDAYAFLLYVGRPPRPPVAAVLQLPPTFIPTHATEGLPGYPARDFFSPAGSTVGCPVDGTIRKLSGHDPREGGHPGGPYGWSMYLRSPDGDRFLTHFGTRAVTLGQHVKRGDILGTICDAAVAHMPSSLSHTHYGFHRAL